LLSAKRLLFIEVVDIDTDLVVVALNHAKLQVLELLFDKRVVEGSAQQSLEAVHRVLHVGDHLIFGSHSNDAVPGTEGHA